MALVTNPDSIKILQLMGNPAGRIGLTGNPANFKNGKVRHALTTLHLAIENGASVVDRLSRDISRTEVERHHRARKAANDLNAAVDRSRATLIAEATVTDAEGAALIDGFFELEKINPFLLTAKFEYLRTEWANPNGGALNISAAIKADPQIASLIVRPDSYITRIPEEQRHAYTQEAIDTHIPKANELFAEAAAIRKVADKLPKLQTSVSASFFRPDLAARWADRVED